MRPICIHPEGERNLGHIDGFAPYISSTRVELFYEALTGIKGPVHCSIAVSIEAKLLNIARHQCVKCYRILKILSLRLH